MNTLLKGLLLGGAMAALAGGASAAGFDFGAAPGAFGYVASAPNEGTPLGLPHGRFVFTPEVEDAGLKNLIDGAGRKLTIIDTGGYQTAGIALDDPADDTGFEWSSPNASFAEANEAVYPIGDGELTIIDPADDEQATDIWFGKPATDSPALQWTPPDLSGVTMDQPAGAATSFYYTAGLKTLVDKAGRPGVIRPLDPAALPKVGVTIPDMPIVPIKAAPVLFDGNGMLGAVYYTGG